MLTLRAWNLHLLGVTLSARVWDIFSLKAYISCFGVRIFHCNERSIDTTENITFWVWMLMFLCESYSFSEKLHQDVDTFINFVQQTPKKNLGVHKILVHKIWFYPPPPEKGPKWGKTVQISRKSSKVTLFRGGGGNAIYGQNDFMDIWAFPTKKCANLTTWAHLLCLETFVSKATRGAAICSSFVAHAPFPPSAEVPWRRFQH